VALTAVSGVLELVVLGAALLFSSAAGTAAAGQQAKEAAAEGKQQREAGASQTPEQQHGQQQTGTPSPQLLLGLPAALLAGAEIGWVRRGSGKLLLMHMIVRQGCWGIAGALA